MRGEWVTDVKHVCGKGLTDLKDEWNWIIAKIEFYEMLKRGVAS
jgi:hypothetical protein